MNAEIINIGEELLIGQVVNTNASWISQKLNEAGVRVSYITVVTDEAADIKDSLARAVERTSLVIITGGLGPTKDDVTKEVIADFFDTELVLNDTVLEDIKKYFQKRSMDINELNYLQAMVPKGCEVIRNPEGTAPGMVLKRDEKIVVSLPGVPYEMKYMIEDYVIPEIKKKNNKNIIVQKTILTQGIPESFMAEKLEDWENSLPKNIQLAYLPSAATVRLRLTGKGESKSNMEKAISTEIEKLKQIIPEYIYGYDNDTLEGLVLELMTAKDLTLGVAESCSGGYISHLITSIPGSSKCFKGSIIAYSNEIKESQLYVPEQIITKYGAVSSQVAEAMAEGARKVLKVDYSVAVTGIAGPDGGTEEKPIGLVYIAISSEKETTSKKYLFGDKRERNIIRSSLTALNMLRKQIKGID